MTQSKQPASGIMFCFTYRDNPRTHPEGRYDVIRFFPGTDALRLKHCAQNHAHKTGALSARPITSQEYQELLENEKAKQTASTTIAA